VQISEVTAQRLTTEVGLEPRGTIEVRGRGPMRVLLVSQPDEAPTTLPATPARTEVDAAAELVER
jgi:hypothetical protein